MTASKRQLNFCFSRAVSDFRLLSKYTKNVLIFPYIFKIFANFLTNSLLVVQSSMPRCRFIFTMWLAVCNRGTRSEHVVVGVLSDQLVDVSWSATAHQLISFYRFLPLQYHLQYLANSLFPSLMFCETRQASAKCQWNVLRYSISAAGFFATLQQSVALRRSSVNSLRHMKIAGKSRVRTSRVLEKLDVTVVTQRRQPTRNRLMWRDRRSHTRAQIFSKRNMHMLIGPFEMFTMTSSFSPAVNIFRMVLSVFVRQNSAKTCTTLISLSNRRKL